MTASRHRHEVYANGMHTRSRERTNKLTMNMQNSTTLHHSVVTLEFLAKSEREREREREDADWDAIIHMQYSST